MNEQRSVEIPPLDNGRLVTAGRADVGERFVEVEVGIFVDFDILCNDRAIEIIFLLQPHPSARRVETADKHPFLVNHHIAASIHAEQQLRRLPTRVHRKVLEPIPR